MYSFNKIFGRQGRPLRPVTQAAKILYKFIFLKLHNDRYHYIRSSKVNR